MNLLDKIHHSLHLPAPDPLGGGLAEAIEAEQSEPEAIMLVENPDEDGERLIESWQSISEDLHQDPLWYSDIDE